jgi:hypothetical protein
LFTEERTARTGVQFEGTGKYRVPIGYPAPEEPMRLAGPLYRVARCLIALGLHEEQAAALAVRAACDSVPLARFRALRAVADDGPATVSSVWQAIGRGNRWGAKWELTALEAIGMVEVAGPTEALRPEYREKLSRTAPSRSRAIRTIAASAAPLSDLEKFPTTKPNGTKERFFDRVLRVQTDLKHVRQRLRDSRLPRSSEAADDDK